MIMGMYTEIYVRCHFKKDLPEEVLLILNDLFNDENLVVENLLPDHPFFKCERWGLIGSWSSYYHIPFSLSKLWKDEIDSSYYLISRSDLKNYDNEIEKFFDWIMPYIDADDGDFIGYKLYEEDREPTLIFYHKPDEEEND